MLTRENPPLDALPRGLSGHRYKLQLIIVKREKIERNRGARGPRRPRAPPPRPCARAPEERSVRGAAARACGVRPRAGLPGCRERRAPGCRGVR